MPDEEALSTEYIKGGFARSDDIILAESTKTRLVFRPGLHGSGVNGQLIRQKISEDHTWRDINDINFVTAPADSGVIIPLDTKATGRLFRKLHTLYQVQQQGIAYGRQSYVVAKEDSVLIINDKTKLDAIRQLLKKDYAEDFWEELTKEDPDLATRLSLARIQQKRQYTLAEFEEKLQDETQSEQEWQSFIEANDWILGYGLRYQILRAIEDQPIYGGTRVNRKGGERGDFLAVTSGEASFTVLIEIKKPTTPLLKNSEYRNGAWAASDELSGSIAQIQSNCSTWEVEGSRTDGNRELLANNDAQVVSPKGIVIIGRLKDLDTREQRRSFELFRGSLHSPEIITYDELYQRAKFIIEKMQDED